MLKTPVMLLILSVAIYSHAQIPEDQPVNDTAGIPRMFTRQEAQVYIQQVLRDDLFWRRPDDSVKSDLNRLLFHTIEPYDSVEVRLSTYNPSAVPVRLLQVLLRDSTRIRWLNDSTFVVDSMGWNKSLMLKQQIIITPPEEKALTDLSDTEILPDSGGMSSDTLPMRPDSLSLRSDSILPVPDTTVRTVIDTAALAALDIRMFGYRNAQIEPSLDEPDRRRSAIVTTDSLFLVYTDTLYTWVAERASPFRVLSGPHQLDSLERAIETLLAYNDQRDSTRVILSDLFGRRTPVWLTQGDNHTQRFWAKNYRNDSITLWVGNPSPSEISLMLEDDIQVDRITKAELVPLPRALKELDRELAEMAELEANPIFWDYDLTSSFALNQTYLANWTKGGESSLSTLLDITGGAIYNNKEANTEWINSLRVNIGALHTQEKGLRKNNDLIELNSKFNRNASGKFGFSASFYMKSQVAKGKNYPNDSVVVSKFLNPASMTVGLGAEYKPFKNTSINVAPLSYRNTFVLDTAMIDQTLHGISKDRKSKQELGTQVVVYNKFTAVEDLVVTNRLRLFSNYLDKPQNIDVDWEMLLDRKINWFFTIRLNLHLIYDDNVRFAVLDSEDNPVLNPDGSEKKVARTQFKEFLGLSVLFQF
ncbi:MAG: DUF3078 domain-containing protein [Bacteroidales bacterium]